MPRTTKVDPNQVELDFSPQPTPKGSGKKATISPKATARKRNPSKAKPVKAPKNAQQPNGSGSNDAEGKGPPKPKVLLGCLGRPKGKILATAYRVISDPNKPDQMRATQRRPLRDLAFNGDPKMGFSYSWDEKHLKEQVEKIVKELPANGQPSGVSNDALPGEWNGYALDTDLKTKLTIPKFISELKKLGPPPSKKGKNPGSEEAESSDLSNEEEAAESDESPQDSGEDSSVETEDTVVDQDEKGTMTRDEWNKKYQEILKNSRLDGQPAKVTLYDPEGEPPKKANTLLLDVLYRKESVVFDVPTLKKNVKNIVDSRINAELNRWLGNHQNATREEWEDYVKDFRLVSKRAPVSEGAPVKMVRLWESATTLNNHKDLSKDGKGAYYQQAKAKGYWIGVKKENGKIASSTVYPIKAWDSKASVLKKLESDDYEPYEPEPWRWGDVLRINGKTLTLRSLIVDGESIRGRFCETGRAMKSINTLIIDKKIQSYGLPKPTPL